MSTIRKYYPLDPSQMVVSYRDFDVEDALRILLATHYDDYPESHIEEMFNILDGLVQSRKEARTEGNFK